MESSKPAKPARSEPAPKQADKGAEDAPDLSESDAEAPGPITPEHESGSWEQTLAEREGKSE